MGLEATMLGANAFCLANHGLNDAQLDQFCSRLEAQVGKGEIRPPMAPAKLVIDLRANPVTDVGFEAVVSFVRRHALQCERIWIQETNIQEAPALLALLFDDRIGLMAGFQQLSIDPNKISMECFWRILEA